MAIEKMTVTKDRQSTPTWGLTFTEGYKAALDPDTETSLAVPAGSVTALCSYTDRCVVSDASIVLAVSDTFAAERGAWNREMIDVTNITTLYFRAIAAVSVRVEFFKR